MKIRGHEIVGRMPLFKPELRQAIRDGRKTQTRRVIKPQPLECPHCANEGFWIGTEQYTGEPEQVQCEFCYTQPSVFTYKSNPPECPYGKPGDIRVMTEPLVKDEGRNAVYSDDNKLVQMPDYDAYMGYDPLPWRWKRDTLPAMFMPTNAARTLCRITEVRVERVQDISVDDADAEGFAGDFPGNAFPDIFPGAGDNWCHLSIPGCFGVLWDSINAKRGYPWASNPWVRVIEFEVVA